MTDNHELGYKGNYGLELIVDMKGCDLSDLTCEKLGRFLVDLVDRVKMVRHGDPLFWEDHSGVPHLDGISAVQFIETSNVVCHALPILRAIYLNLFSCKPFDADDALGFCMDYWGASSENHTVVTRV
jgi:hypothetical protein